MSTSQCAWIKFDGRLVNSPQLAGSSVYAIRGGPYGMTGQTEGFSVNQPPTERSLKLVFDLRGSVPGQTFAILAVGLGLPAKPEFSGIGTPDQQFAHELTRVKSEWQISGSLPSNKWTHLECDLSLSTDVRHLKVILHNPNTDTIYMGQPHLEPGPPEPHQVDAMARARRQVELPDKGAEPPPTSSYQKSEDSLASQKGPVVAHIHMRAPICTKKPGEHGLATFPVPALDDSQVPLAFKIECQAPGKLLSYSWRKRSDGRNMVCDIKVQPGTKGSWVEYEALVLLTEAHQHDQTAPKLVKSAQTGTFLTEWSESSACVQSTASEIRDLSRTLAKPGDTDETYAKRVFEYVRDDRGKGAPFKALDALAAIQCGGSCTNKANLVAALLRAHGIPARTVTHMPTWCRDKLYEHWLAEYWNPKTGWVAIDSALGRWEPDRRTRVVLATSSTEDENLAFNPLHERFVMPGAPYQSVLELTPKLFPADLADDDAINSADQVVCLQLNKKQEAGLFASARAGFRSLYPQLQSGKSMTARYARVLAASKRKNTQSLVQAIR
jgi:hypothetical protein